MLILELTHNNATIEGRSPALEKQEWGLKAFDGPNSHRFIRPTMLHINSHM